MTDPVLALEKFDTNWSQVQKGDQANTYWYIHSMMQSGYKTEDILPPEILPPQSITIKAQTNIRQWHGIPQIKNSP